MPQTLKDTTAEDIFAFTVKDIEGDEVNLAKYKGNVLLIVNTASECGYTPQYEGLQALYEEYKEQGFYVLGFPANNFGGQEPGTNTEIKQFCSVNFDVQFLMFSKISVKGEQQSPLFKYLTSTVNPDFTGEIKWNFEKFLISKDGKLLHRFRSPVEPMSKNITRAVEQALQQ
ncbi:MAG: glutathione peroxidase [Bacteroidota bacterium]